MRHTDTRQRITEYLKAHPESTGLEISKALGVRSSTVHQHLKIVGRRVGQVNLTNGRTIVWSFNDAPHVSIHGLWPHCGP